MSKAVFFSSYLPPVEYYTALLKHKENVLEMHEHFPKQTYRNRCYLYSPNGKQMLVVPLMHAGEHTPIKDIRISYDSNWQMIHWRSMEAAYRRSPYFEFYEDDLHPFYHTQKFDFLLDLNMELMNTINEMIKMNVSFLRSDEYHKEYTDAVDYRSSFTPNKIKTADTRSAKYSQVFETKHGFIPDLSVVDLLFNHGPNSTQYLIG